MIWEIKKLRLDLSQEARIMGILNVTPDSFSDGGNYDAVPSAITHARKMIAEGATIIDIGGESTRPGATPVHPGEELQRTVPVIRALRAEWDGLISIDTTKAVVAASALQAGADIVNDVSGLTLDPGMASICAQSGCGIVIMHSRGTPCEMQDNPAYGNVCDEIRAYFLERLNTLTALGISPGRLCFDPGIGFGKSLDHNLALLREIGSLSPGNRPLLLGVSRKSFLGKITDAGNPSARDAPTIAITAYSRGEKVMLHRVHAVRENIQALRVVESLQPTR